MPTITIQCKLALVIALMIVSSGALGQVSAPAVVTDGSGGAVHGLSKSDFTVSCGENASFDSVEEVPALNFTTFSDPTPVFILFDALTVAPPVQGNVERLLLTYLRKAADEHLAVTVLANSDHGLLLVHDMATDTKIFSAAMDQVMPKSTKKATRRGAGRRE